ncbi:Na+/H+ antiporter [Paracoccus aminophilus]|uniref:Na+/H+ antiporter n=1 Tax=Paracoccus aminophilus JCM 7686 TaxID=1367847 RepID=S5XWV3_PARAH|nr:Na+/H+ antiporter [Paracoccus aminophilus]AGT09792.1 Na+/H+ antiporter [Paracoccus aminophilus JCM 7686]
MQAISTILIMLVAVVISGVIVRMPRLSLPLPLIQIALGAGLASVTDFGVRLEPDVFFLLFLPPLLFLDGWRMPKEGFFRNKATILELAFGLVFFTVFGVGYFIHWMIPSMPLPVAFALAAIISPTDPVAVSSIAGRLGIPKRLMHILEGEALFNDASGLVCMRFAVVAALTGVFSPAEAAVSFLWMVVGGILSGVLVTLGVGIAKGWVSRRFGEETGSEILISLLIPFSAYLLAEEIGASGILAAVSAGMTMGFSELRGQDLASTRVQRAVVWDAIQFTLNGLMFVLLGEQLPHIVRRAIGVVGETGHTDPVWLLIYVLAITLALGVLRYLWVWVSLKLTIFRMGQRRAGQKTNRPSRRLIMATSLAGVRGAVTLAGILTLPFTLNDGTPFPARDLAICLAAGVIILSLILASIGLPFVLKGLQLPPEPHHAREEDHARIAAAEAALRAIEAREHVLSTISEEPDIWAAAAAHVMDRYRQRIDALDGEDDAETGAPNLNRRQFAIELDLWKTGLNAERQEIYRFARGRQLPGETVNKLVREIDLMETRLNEAV